MLARLDILLKAVQSTPDIVDLTTTNKSCLGEQHGLTMRHQAQFDQTVEKGRFLGKGDY